jgi:hypothetical protein
MSTRAGIIIKDSYNEVHFYRHSDGYPDGTMPTLNIFLRWLKDGVIRNDAMQSAGWLVIIGAMEYNTIPEVAKTLEPSYGGRMVEKCNLDTLDAPTGWKVGSYEPTTNVGNHGDLEYIYTIDLNKKTITVKEL